MSLPSLPDRPFVTVAMPAHNYGRYVGQAVESVFQQTYRPLELIVVDNGSTDDTAAVLDRLKPSSPFRMHVLQVGHSGVSAAMNLCLEQARGELVSIIHADDVYEPRKVEAQVSKFLRDPSAVLVHCDYQVIDQDGCEVPGLDSSADRPAAVGDALRGILEARSDVRSMTMMYRRDVMTSLGGYDETLPSEDWQSILRLAKAGMIGHVPQKLVGRRVHQNNYSKQLYRGRSFSINEIAPNVLQEVVPPDLDLPAICGRSVGSVVANALAEGNIRKAVSGFRTGWTAYPGGRLALLRRLPSGFRSLIWMRFVQPLIPDSAVAELRRLKGKRASR